MEGGVPATEAVGIGTSPYRDFGLSALSVFSVFSHYISLKKQQWVGIRSSSYRAPCVARSASMDDPRRYTNVAREP